MEKVSYDLILEYIKLNFKKEYFCHLQFVEDIALTLQLEKGGDIEVVKIASMSHDIGRIENGENSDHAEEGAKKIIELLNKSTFTDQKINLISRCVLMHNKFEGFQNIEEEIVSNADAMSKITYHNFFMLLTKKDNYLERAKWGLKHLDKNYNKITYEDQKELLKQKYYFLRDNYLRIIENK